MSAHHQWVKINNMSSGIANSNVITDLDKTII